MANHWFKFYGSEFLADPKTKRLNASERSCWITILCYAQSSGKDGVINYITEDQIMIDAGIFPGTDEWKKTKGVLEKLSSMKMIESEKEQIKVLNWSKRQDMALTPYERVKRYREKHKETDDNDNDNTGDNGIDNIEQNRTDKNRIEKNRVEMFEQFWIAYPNKKTKKKAYDSWKKINPSDKLFKEIMSGLERSKSSKQWQKDDGQYIPHPTTWLNQERWNDEDTPFSAKPKKDGKYAHLT